MFRSVLLFLIGCGFAAHSSAQAYLGQGKAVTTTRAATSEVQATTLWISDPDPSVRSKAAYSLATTEPLSSVPAIFDLAKNDPALEVRVNSVRALGSISNLSVEKGFAALLVPDTPGPVRYEVVKALGRFRSDTSLTLLINELKNTTDAVRPVVLESLGRRADTRAYPVVATYLNASNPLVGSRAAWALGEIRDRGAVPQLMKSAEQSTSLEVRRESVSALGRIGDKSANTVLLKLALSAREEPSLRVAAVKSLGRVDQASLNPAALVALSTDGDPYVRSAASFALWKSKDKRAEFALRSLTTDADPTVQISAVTAMGLDPRRYAEDLAALAGDRSAQREVRLNALTSLSTLSPKEVGAEPVLNRLVPLLNKLEPVEVQVATVSVLSQVDTPAAKSALRRFGSELGIAEVVRDALRAD